MHLIGLFCMQFFIPRQGYCYKNICSTEWPLLFSYIYMFAVHRLLIFFLLNVVTATKTSLPLPRYYRIVFTVPTVVPWIFTVPTVITMVTAILLPSPLPCHPLVCGIVSVIFVNWNWNGETVVRISKIWRYWFCVQHNKPGNGNKNWKQKLKRKSFPK